MKWKKQAPPLPTTEDTASTVNASTAVGKEKSDSKKEPDEKTKAPLTHYWRILSFGSKPEHGLMLAAFVASSASGVAMPLMQIVFGNLTGTFNSYTVDPSRAQSDFNRTLDRFSLYIFLLFIGKFILCYISMFCFRVVGLRISAAIRLSYLKSLFCQSVAKLDVVSAGAVSNTITSSANAIQVSISDRLAYLFQSLALIIAAYTIAFIFSWQLTLISSAQLIFIVIVYSFTTPPALRAMHRLEKSDEKHASVASEIFASIRTVFSLGAERALSQKYYKLVNESEKNASSLGPWVAVQIFPMFFAVQATFALAFWAGLGFYNDGTIPDVNTVIVAFFSILIIVSILGQVVQPIMDIFKAVTASLKIFEMIDSEIQDTDGKRAPEVSAHGDIELQGVSFAYPTRAGVQVLRDFNARFQRGKTTALVGPSGCGKSTIVGLLERWYGLEESQGVSSALEGTLSEKPVSERHSDSENDKAIPNTGVIMCGEHNINSLNLKWWRTQIGLVQQEPFLFNDTIVNNVSYGLLGTEWEDVSEEEKLKLVKQACEEAFADEFIEKLPKGYSTMVGESGIKLSGGQRQRLAIARSIVRRPAILILDEATSAIDIRSEAIVQKALDQVSKDRTTIVIAHRLATIRKADRIIVLRNGTKLEEGTHQELLADEDGLYSGLVRAQKIQEEATDDEAEYNEKQPAELLRRDTTGAVSIGESEAEVGQVTTYKNRGFWASVGLMLYEQRAQWLLMILTVLAAMGAGGSFPLSAWFFARLIEVFTFTGQRLLNARDHWSLMFFILALTAIVFYGVLGYATAIISAKSSSSTRRDYFANTIRQPISYFDGEGNSSGALMSRLSTDPKNIGELLGLNGAFPLISIFNLVGSVIISFCFGWKLTLVVIFAAMPVLLICQFIKIRNEFKFDEINAKVFAQSSSFATEAVGAFRTVSSLTMEDTIINKYSQLLSDQIASSTRRASYAMLLNAFCDSAELAAMALAFWYGGRLLGSREYNVTQFFVIYVAIIQGSIAAGQFFSAAPSIVTATASANRILSLRELNRSSPNTTSNSYVPKNETPSAPPTTKPNGDNSSGAAIELSRVSFQYPTRPTPTFRNLSITIPSGSFAAFVGPSGCGKTSVISLLSRFYEPTSGTLLLNDQDVKSLPLQPYRAGISLVAQEPRLFSGTIMENLLLGLPEDTQKALTREEIESSCRDAEIHDFIISLPEGYETDLGGGSSGGVTALSGGQKQRLCLARALLRKPRLLLLDEATSSLDSQSERLVQGAIERLAGKGAVVGEGEHSKGGKKGMTVVAVAHRLATIQKADVIFVFGESEVAQGGAKILERGSHAELMRMRGAYWQMCRAQALDR